jgi:hypothetical protein
MRKGYRDGMVRSMQRNVCASIPFALVPLLGLGPYPALASVGLCVFFMMATTATGPAALQSFTPNHLRGECSGLYLLTVNRNSLGVFAACTLAGAAALFSWWRRPMRVQMEASGPE